MSAAASPWADACLNAGVSPETIAHLALLEALQPVLAPTKPGRAEHDLPRLLEQRRVEELKLKQARYQAMLRGGRAA